MKPGTPWSRKMVNEQLLRVVSEVLAQLNHDQSASPQAGSMSAGAGGKS